MQNIVRKHFWLMLIALAGCATTHPGTQEVLETDDYTLTVIRHCPEAKTACSRLTATLFDKRYGDEKKLRGRTQVVKCAGGVAPCPLSFYQFESGQLEVRAYSDGALEVFSYDLIVLGEGTWRRVE